MTGVQTCALPISRCYRGGVGRTRMKVLKFTSKDIIAFALFAVVFASIIATRIFL